jgi:hypothetical protein
MPSIFRVLDLPLSTHLAFRLGIPVPCNSINRRYYDVVVWMLLGTSSVESEIGTESGLNDHPGLDAR